MDIPSGKRTLYISDLDGTLLDQNAALSAYAKAALAVISLLKSMLIRRER